VPPEPPGPPESLSSSEHTQTQHRRESFSLESVSSVAGARPLSLVAEAVATHQTPRDFLFDLIAKISTTCTEAVSGEDLSVKDQLIHICVAGDGSVSSISSCAEMLGYLLQGRGWRIALFAEAGSGKSWLMLQLMQVCSKQRDGGSGNLGGWAPIFVQVQAITSTLHSQLEASDENDFRRKAAATLTAEWIIEHAAGVTDHPEVVAMLKDTAAAGRAVFVFDGVDEAGVVREVVEDFILAIGQKHRVIVTSRPEGVRRKLYEQDEYLLLTLQPLTSEQQQMMIDRRLADGSAATTFFKNLFSFREARTLQDHLHAKNFPLGLIERLRPIKGDEMQYAAEIKGRLVDNQTVLFERARQAKPIFDAELRQIAKDTGTTLKQADLKGTTEKSVVTVDENGDEVAVATGESYSGELRNAVPRLAVKAWDDELKRLQKAGEVGKDKDGKVPQADKAKVTALFEAWKAGATVNKVMPGLATVKDVVRASVMCGSEEQMVQVYDAVRLNKSFEIARFKNFFAKLGPTHFRRIGLNLRVKLPDGGSHVCELQVHHSQIYDGQPDHKVYEYFRDVFVGGEFDGRMDDLIGKRMKHLEDVMPVPVLMSLLIVCVDGDGGAVPDVPATVGDLYQTAMTKLYQQRGDRHGFDGQQMQQLVRTIFTQNQLRRRRQFSQVDVELALQDAAEAEGKPEALEERLRVWNEAVANETLPFIKTLVKPDGRGGATQKAARLQLHPVRRGATQFYAVADLCEACCIDREAADAFTASLGPDECHKASSAEKLSLQDQEVLEQGKRLTSGEYRGPVTVIGEGMGTKNKFLGEDGEMIESCGNPDYVRVKFPGGGDDSFLWETTLAMATPVLLLSGATASTLLQECTVPADTIAAFEDFLAGAANAGLFQATHLSLQESECAERFACVAMDKANRPQRKEGMMKWFTSTQAATAILNDRWYLNTAGLVRKPAETEQQQAFVKALFPDSEGDEHEGAELTIKGFASKSLSTVGIEALFTLGSTLTFSVDLSGALADTVEGAKAVASMLSKW
jgi:hypothetical protein